MLDSKAVVIREKRILTLQSNEFGEIQNLLREMRTDGWNIEKFPHLHFGKWEAMLSR